MAQEYIIMKEKCDIGMIALSKSVFDTITEISIDDVESVVKCNQKQFNKPIQSKIVSNRLQISVDIKMKYGANVSSVCEIFQNKIFQNVYQMTGLKCDDIRINVVGFQI